jgi:hypothetical protein
MYSDGSDSPAKSSVTETHASPPISEKPSPKR